MNRSLEDILDQAVDRLLAGETVEDCLAAYPDVARELEPLLRTAQAVAKAAAVEPRPGFVAEARYRMRHTMSQPRGRRRWPSLSLGRRWALLVGAVLLLLVTSGMIPASANALPDEPLYPIKRAQEQVVNLWFRDDAALAGRRLDLAGHRLEEMECLSRRGRRIPPFLVRDLTEETNLAEQHMERQLALRVDLAQRLLQMSTRQQAVLEQLAEGAPPEAEEDIQQALHRVEERRQRALHVLEQQGPMEQQGPPMEQLGPPMGQHGQNGQRPKPMASPTEAP